MLEKAVWGGVTRGEGDGGGRQAGLSTVLRISVNTPLKNICYLGDGLSKWSKWTAGVCTVFVIEFSPDLWGYCHSSRGGKSVR